jgi:hypothetical protein
MGAESKGEEKSKHEELLVLVRHAQQFVSPTPQSLSECKEDKVSVRVAISKEAEGNNLFQVSEFGKM